MAESGERQDWVDDLGGEGDIRRKRAADARAVLDAAVGRATAREAPRTASLATLLGRTPSVDATGAAVAPNSQPDSSEVTAWLKGLDAAEARKKEAEEAMRIARAKAARGA